MSKFADKKTIVKYIEVNLDTQDFTQREEVIDYCRSLDKAKKIIEENNGVKNKPNIVISVTELVQEQAKQYDNGLLYNYCKDWHYNEETAKTSKETLHKDAIIIKGFMYEITGVIWGKDENGDYFTEEYTRTSPVNLNKLDQKAALSFELPNDCKALAFDNVTKTKLPIWFIVDREDAKLCIVD